MKKPVIAIVISLLIILLGSCASVKFFSDNELSERTGLRIYTARPYLLVERYSEKDKPGKTTLIWLPDLANPQYVVIKPGVGSNELKLAFANGSLSSYGVTAESNIPEIINSLAGIVSRSAYAVQNLSVPPPARQEPASEVSFELFEIVTGKDGAVLKKINILE